MSRRSPLSPVFLSEQKDYPDDETQRADNDGDHTFPAERRVLQDPESLPVKEYAIVPPEEIGHGESLPEPCGCLSPCDQQHHGKYRRQRRENINQGTEKGIPETHFLQHEA